MKAAYLKRLDSIEFRDVVLPGPSPQQIRLRVDACGICGTDVTAALEGNADYQPFGHEIAGTIVETGAAVTNCIEGQKVVLDSASACGVCNNCKDARQELCEDVQCFALQGHYGFAEEMLSPAVSAVGCEGVPPEQACLSEPLGVAIDMHRLADIRVGSHVVVSGLGAIGLMALRLARLSGAEKIYACDLSTATIRTETALKFGADEIIEVDKTPVENYKFTSPPDRFMVSSPPRTIPAMIQAAARGAIISYIGIEYGEGARITFDANHFHFKKLQLRASFASPALCTPFAARLIETGTIDAGSLVTHVFGLDNIAEALRVAATEQHKALKVVVVKN